MDSITGVKTVKTVEGGKAICLCILRFPFLFDLFIVLCYMFYLLSHLLSVMPMLLFINITVRYLSQKCHSYTYVPKNAKKGRAQRWLWRVRRYVDILEPGCVLIMIVLLVWEKRSCGVCKVSLLN